MSTAILTQEVVMYQLMGFIIGIAALAIIGSLFFGY